MGIWQTLGILQPLPSETKLLLASEIIGGCSLVFAFVRIMCLSFDGMMLDRSEFVRVLAFSVSTKTLLLGSSL